MSSTAKGVSDWFKHRTLRTQLLLSVNLLVGVGLIPFLYADYRHGMRVAMETKAASLTDEARAIAVAIEPLQGIGTNAVQAHIDAVCSAMNQVESPGHMIKVRFGDQVLRSHPSLHGEIVSMDRMDHEPRIVGSTVASDIRVEVSERTEGTIRETKREAVMRAGVIAVSSILGAGLISVLLLRLVSAPISDLTTFVRGVGRGEFGKAVKTGGSAEISFLSSEISSMSRELARRARDRQRQLARARQLQQHLMAPHESKAHHGSAIAFHPADEVAGDFAEIVDLEDGSVVLCLADVSGHGIAAAMGAAMIKALLLSIDLSMQSPASLLNQIGVRYLNASLPGDFVSMIALHINAQRTSATYASAGHEPCYVRHSNGRITRLDSTGMLLGIGENANCEDAVVSLSMGDAIVLLSDGISEAMNERGDHYGRARIVETLSTNSMQGPEQLVSLICESARRHRQTARSTDDMTVLAYAVHDPV